jgi:hypothetical protein
MSNGSLYHKIVNCSNIRRLLYSLFFEVASLTLLYFSKLDKFVFMFPIRDVLNQLIRIAECLELFYRFRLTVHRISNSQLLLYVKLETYI